MLHSSQVFSEVDSTYRGPSKNKPGCNQINTPREFSSQKRRKKGVSKNASKNAPGMAPAVQTVCIPPAQQKQHQIHLSQWHLNAGTPRGGYKMIQLYKIIRLKNQRKKMRWSGWLVQVRLSWVKYRIKGANFFSRKIKKTIWDQIWHTLDVVWAIGAIFRRIWALFFRRKCGSKNKIKILKNSKGWNI